MNNSRHQSSTAVPHTPTIRLSTNNLNQDQPAPSRCIRKLNTFVFLLLQSQKLVSLKECSVNKYFDQRNARTVINKADNCCQIEGTTFQVSEMLLTLAVAQFPCVGVGRHHVKSIYQGK